MNTYLENLEAGNDRFLQEDLESIVAGTDWSRFKGQKLLVTGATGLVGSRIVLALLCANRIQNLGMEIFPLVRNIEKAKSIFGPVADRPEIEFLVQDLNDEIKCKASINYIIHCASVTTSKTMVEKPVETIKASINGTLNMLDFATSLDSLKGMVYVSSMEMYGSFEESMDTDEDRIGYLNPLVVRSNYPESKRMCENMCVAYWSEYGLPVRIARLSQVFGAGILPGENRVFAQFARSAINGTDIVMHTLGQSEGNYCYLADAIRALLILADRGEDGQAYNIANEASHTTIAGMAQMVSDKIADGKIKTVFDIPESNVFGYAKDTKMKLNASKMRALGWEPVYSLEETYRRLIETIKIQDGIN